MKKLNLIKGLWDDSHEKQSPQRLRRYAVMLLMLLTIGVGQMWAGYNVAWKGNVFFRAPDNWDLSTYSHVQIAVARTTSTNTSTYNCYFGEMTRVGTTRLYYIWVDASHSNWNQNEYVYFSANSSTWGNGDFRVDANHYYTTPVNYDFTSASNPYLYNPTSEGNGASVSGSYSSTGADYAAKRDNLLKKTQRANIYTDGSSSKTGGSVRIDGYYLTGNTSAATSNVNNGSNTYASYDAAIGTTVTLTATASTGYQFDGWYTAGTGGSLVSSSNPYSYTCTGTKTVYARFSEKTYSLTFSHNGHGTIEVGGATVASGSTARVNHINTKTLVATPNTGYNFSSWTKSGSNTSAVTIGNASDASTTIKATNTGATITAGFTAKTTTVTLDNQGATTAGEDEITATYDAAVPSIASDLPAKTGYTFGGYYTGTGGSGTKYINADGTSAKTWNIADATKTLYAKWTENMSTVALVADPSGKGTFQVGGVTVTSTQAGVTTTPSVTAYPISGYRFAGWSISGGASISSTSDNPTTVTGGGAGTAATLTATFEEDLTYFDVTFGVGTSYTSLGSISATNNTTSSSISSGDDILSASSITFTASPNTGYKVDGFYSDASCETELQSGASTTYTIASLGADVDVYVKFIPITYTITYNLNSGSNPGGAPTSFTIESSDVTLPTPTRTGYTFEGWYANSGLTGDAVTTIANGSYGNKEYWAKWSEKMTTVTVNVSPTGTGTLTVAASAFTPGNTTTAGVTTSRTVVASPINSDYTFGSWGVTGNATGTNSTNTYTLKGNGSAGTGTLTANFTLVPCSLYYGSSTPLNSPSSAVMSYDLEEQAYYIDVTTNSSPYYFRFLRDSKEWSGNWTSYPDVNAVTANGSKVACATETQGWGNKASIKYVGNSGTSIRIWFDYQNQKTWITADKDKEYVLRGYKYDDSGAGGMPGWSATTTYFDGLASGNTGTITATLSAATKYKFKVYDRYTDAWYGHSTNNVEQEVTDGTLYATGTGTNNNFYFTSTIAGTYTFTVDKTSGLKVKVDFPVSYQLNYDIGTVKGTNGSISTDPTTASGSYVPSGNSVELTAPAAKTGYTWSGWFTNAAGTEGQIADVNGVISVTMNADKTLYACYTENEYLVTVSTGANGDVSPKGTVNVKQISGTSLTATPSTGYHFDHWAISGGGITPTSSTTSPQTFKATETGGTIQAIFAETTYSVNVISGNTNFGSVSTASVSGIGIATYSDEITATPETGATFTGWTLPAGVTAAAGYTSASNPIRIHASASGRTITANFSETKYTATITTEDDDYGTVSPTSASVGQITAVQITASKKTGYMFAGWEQTAGSGTVTYHVAAGAGHSVDASGSSQPITYITIDGNVTLQATWEEDRSAGWYLRGNWTDGWETTGQKEFIKNVGETAGTVSYVRWTLAPEMFTDATMQMKMHDGSTYYGHSTDFDAAGNLCTKDNNNSNITFYSGVAYQNFKVSIPVAGEYIFRWDSSTKQLTITYPAGNFIRGTFDSWSWDHVLEPTGNANELSCVISMTGDKAPHAWTGGDGFKVVLAGDHYGKNSTGVTRASNSVSSLKSDGANINWTTDVRGDYTFTVNSSSKTVTVTYPNAYTVTYGYGAGGSSVSASATSVGGTFSSGAYVAAGDDITFTQTPVDGNTFNGWFNAASGGDAISCMASDNVYDDIAGNINVYAQYIPTTYTNVTLNATTGSTNGAYSVTFGGTTITVTTYPLKTGYEPEGYYESYADGKWTNKIANSDGTLRNSTTYTDATGHWTSTASPTLYTKWQPKTYAIKLDKNGSSAGYLTDGSVTTTYDSNTLTSLIAPTRTGYHIVDGYYKEPGLTNKIINVNGTLCASTDYTDASGNWTNDGAVTLYAKWAPNTYTITFAPAGGTVDPTSASVTFDAAIADAPVPDRTGYTFTGYNTAGGTSITTNGGVFKSSVDGFTDGSAHWIQPDDATITAQWSANPYTITLTQSTETGYGSAGTASVTATYDAALPSIASLPTAANGYAFMGYFTDHDGAGTKYYDADGTRLVATYTTASALELFAYFKKAEITLEFDDAVVLPEGTVGVTPTISPTPVGNTIICWTILHSNDTPLDPQPAMTWSEGKLTFAASSYSGTYKVQAVLRTGSSCGGGDALDTETSSFQVAGTHNVTVNYKCGDDVIKASTILENVSPMDWSDEIEAPEIFGYTFSRWDAVDGVTIKNGALDPVTTSTNATIQIKATYAGKLTAVYTQNQMIFFKNTLGWANVYVNFHTGNAWNNTNNPQGSPKGVGNSELANANKHMIQIGESDIYYYDYGAESISPSLYISFTDQTRPSASEFWGANPGINVSYPANYPDAISTDRAAENGFKAATPMFVPLASQEPKAINVTGTGKANYYNAGYWTEYLPGTGYTLEIYNSTTDDFIKSETFTSGDELMPMKAVVDLEGGTTYKFQLRRGGTGGDGVYYGNTGTMTYANHGQDTPWSMTNEMDPFKMVGLTTNAAGDYTFNLSYSANSKTEYRLRIAVDYPVSTGDYRLIYSDAVQTKPLSSAIITKENDGSDTTSFFVRPGSTPVLRIQQATVALDGTVTWNEYPTIGTPTNQITGDIASAITAGGTEVYNFNLSMDGDGELSVTSTKIYTGNFYIRTDAANSKWDNYRSDPDHLMTYSEYSITHGGYTHYYTHWVDKDVTGRKNVKFVIANDYSPNISDTLAREAASGTWEHIADFMEEGGDLKRSANVRYMWDKRTNAISRAYVDGAQTAGTLFLTILSADSKILNPSTEAVQAVTTFSDKGNWMYEANVKAKPLAEIKLRSSWGKDGETAHIIDQYFKGAADATEQLIGGSGTNPYDIRLIYDFKTNRLIAGLIPSGDISDPMPINADVMFIREHHGDIAQLTFSDDGAITEIKTAFGVLQFNKWTINNKSKESGHSPLSPLLSNFERDLFYVSFPFKVAMEDVFGFGTYGQHWIIEEYDGATRAKNGYWLESKPNWKFVTNRKGKYFEPGQGYIIALDLDELGESSSVWTNTDRVELYFPSYGTMDNITSSTATYEIPSHLCTINRSEESDGHGGTLGSEYDRRVKDSHWNVLGVPTYVNPDAPNFANTDWTTEAGETSIGPNFLYAWNMDDNTMSAVSASGYRYHAMHAYLVQYCGDVTWTSSVSVAPSDIVARRKSAEKPQNVEFKLELSQNEKMVDQTFVKLSDDEHVTTGFEFNYDLSKEFNANKANIYTLIAKEPVAGNVLPLTEQTTVIPVGVKIAANGDYTFAIPDGTDGIGITLIDNETGIRTSLSALDYTINLNAGTYNERFLLEISPVHQSPTDIETISDEGLEIRGVRKVLIDGILYIVKDGVMYDARGSRVQ